MRKLLFLIFAVVLLASCSKDDDDKYETVTEERLLGIWKLSEYEYDAEADDDAVEERIENKEGFDNSYKIQFTENNSFGDYADSSQNWDWSRKYYLEGSTLYICPTGYNPPNYHCDKSELKLKNGKLYEYEDVTEIYKSEYPNAGIKEVIIKSVYIKQ